MDMEDFKKIPLHSIKKGALTNGKLTGIIVLNAKETILKEILFHSLLISVLVNTVWVLIDLVWFLCLMAYQLLWVI